MGAGAVALSERRCRGVRWEGRRRCRASEGRNVELPLQGNSHQQSCEGNPDHLHTPTLSR